MDRLVGCGCLLVKASEAGAATGSMSGSAIWAADAEWRPPIGFVAISAPNPR